MSGAEWRAGRPCDQGHIVLWGSRRCCAAVGIAQLRMRPPGSHSCARVASHTPVHTAAHEWHHTVRVGFTLLQHECAHTIIMLSSPTFPRSDGAHFKEGDGLGGIAAAPKKMTFSVDE